MQEKRSQPQKSRPPPPPPPSSSQQAVSSRTVGRRVSSLNVKAMVGQMEKQARQSGSEEDEDEKWTTTESKLRFIDLSCESESDLDTVSKSLSAISKGQIDVSPSTLIPDPLDTFVLAASIHIGNDDQDDASTSKRIVDYVSKVCKLPVSKQSVTESDNNDDGKSTKERAVMTNPETESLVDHGLQQRQEEPKQQQRRQEEVPVSTQSSSSTSSSSSSSLSDSERPHIISTCSTRTTITIPDSSEVQDALLVDLRRQVEELQNQVAVTRERNDYVEKKLKDKANEDSIFNDLKSQLEAAKEALGRSDEALQDQAMKIAEYEAMFASEQQALDQMGRFLRHKKMVLRYVAELETKLDEKDGQELKQLLQKFKADLDPSANLLEDETVVTLKKQLEESRLLLSEAQQQLDSKTTQVSELETQLDQVSKLHRELQALRDAQAKQIQQLEDSLAKAQERTEELQQKQQKDADTMAALQGTIETLLVGQSKLEQELKESKQERRLLDKQMRDQESSMQTQIQLGVEQLERVRLEFRSLEQVEEKQQLIIACMETKLSQMEDLTNTLRLQLSDRDQEILLLEENCDKKEQHIQQLQDKVAFLSRDIEHVKAERTQLNQLVSHVDGTLRLQDTKLHQTSETLQDWKAQYDKEMKDKEILIENLTAEKDELLEKLSKVQSQADEFQKTINEMKQDKLQTDIELQRGKAIEDRVVELDRELETAKREQKALSVELTSKQQLLHSLQQQLQDRNNMSDSSKDAIAKITALEAKIAALQDTVKEDQKEYERRLERALQDVERAEKQKRDMEKSLNGDQGDLLRRLEEKERQLTEKEATITRLSDALALAQKEQKKDSEDTNDDSYVVKDADLVQKVMQLSEDNAQLISQVHDLEGQLVLQRSKMSLETRNLELEIMRLASANNRLEKEMESLLPRRSMSNLCSTGTVVASNSNRDSATNIVSSPPCTPRVLSPPPYHKLPRDISQNSLPARLPKSGSLRSVPGGYRPGDDTVDEELSKRGSSSSVRSEMLLRTMRARASSASAAYLPPPSAPPSNPLPPVPSALPPLPSSPPPQSPPMQPARSLSSTPLQRQDSMTTATVSDINSDGGDSLTSERYERIITTLQRKMRTAEGDVKAHQEVISKLEAQLSRSEHAVREAKKQLEALSREKQASSMEIANLRSQIDQARTQQHSAATKTAEEYQQLEEALERERRLKEKAEKARHILEDRMEELMRKKSKFMCF